MAKRTIDRGAEARDLRLSDRPTAGSHDRAASERTVVIPTRRDLIAASIAIAGIVLQGPVAPEGGDGDLAALYIEMRRMRERLQYDERRVVVAPVECVIAAPDRSSIHAAVTARTPDRHRLCT